MFASGIVLLSFRAAMAASLIIYGVVISRPEKILRFRIVNLSLIANLLFA